MSRAERGRLNGLLHKSEIRRPKSEFEKEQEAYAGYMVTWVTWVTWPEWASLTLQSKPLTCGDSEPEPDVAIVRGAEEDFWQDHPRTAELVIEVCVSSHEYDRSKLRAYVSAAVKECWFVLGAEKQIEVYQRPVGGQYTVHNTHGPGGSLACWAVPEFSLDLDKFFAK
ncbi:MAG: hypothetical protein QOJ40_1100 [Verrucomicrobiota bacterium]